MPLAEKKVNGSENCRAQKHSSGDAQVAFPIHFWHKVRSSHIIVYSGVGADIVMKSITLIDPVLGQIANSDHNLIVKAAMTTTLSVGAFLVPASKKATYAMQRGQKMLPLRFSGLSGS